jgi:FMN reductase (NADPH)
MLSNAVIETIMKRASVRSYTDRMPSDEVIETVVRAGQQAPFAMQLCSTLLQKSGKFVWGAPLNFIILADVHRMQRILEKRGWTLQTNDLTLLLFAMQDAAYMAQNMVIAAQSLGLGSCYIGSAPMMAKKFIESCSLPPKVFPIVMLVMGYPAEETPTRPRYPLSVSLFEETYPRAISPRTTTRKRTSGFRWRMVARIHTHLTPTHGPSTSAGRCNGIHRARG